MSTSDLTAPQFTSDKAAMKHLEASRWPDGPFCPYCGSVNVHRMKGKTQAGMFLCNDCRDKFTARVGTVFERSHIPLHKWMLAIHLLTSSKKGISAHQLHRMLGITYKSAWFMAHRVREAMKGNPKAGFINWVHLELVERLAASEKEIAGLSAKLREIEETAQKKE